MIKRFFLVAVLTMAFLTSTNLVYADGIPGSVYVDLNYKGSEDGTQAFPYNTLQEGIAFGQAQPGGAWLYLKQADGSWIKDQYIKSTVSSPTGVPLADVTVYALLVVLALGLMLVGWQFQKRSRQIRS